MKRGTKEFDEVKASFEKGIKSGFFGYLPSDLTIDDSHATTFYANGQVNAAFRVYMAGYAAAKCVYQQ